MSEGAVCAVLFADISGSTRLYDRVGDQRALALIDRCLRMFTAATVARGGRVIKTIGDEILAVFPTSVSACQAAADMQLGMVSLPDAMEQALSMHSGVHWGEVTLTADDVFGDTVNVAARLVEAAKRGQIVISGEAQRALPAGCGLEARLMGSESVKGKAEPLQLHELLWEPDAELTEMVSLQRTAQPVIAKLVITYIGRTYSLDDAHPALSLGRDPAADIVTVDRLASRLHARFEKSKDKFIYSDVSSNGSFVQINGQDETLLRRDSVELRLSGTISFGRPVHTEPGAAIKFEVAVAPRR